MKTAIKVLVPLIALLMLLSIAPFVLADKPISVSMKVGAGPIPIGVGEKETTPSGIVHVTGQPIAFVNNTLTIDSSPAKIFYSYNIFDINYNPATETMIIHSNAIWYIGSGTTATADGFAGNVETIVYGATSYPLTTPPSSESFHCALQGFGSYEGQTLVLSGKGSLPLSVTGILIVH